MYILVSMWHLGPVDLASFGFISTILESFRDICSLTRLN